MEDLVMSLDEMIEDMYTNLKDTQDIVEGSKASNKEPVLEKYEATLTMLLEGSFAIKDMVKDDLEEEDE